MDRIHDSRWFRAASTWVDWPEVARARLGAQGGAGDHGKPGQGDGKGDGKGDGRGKEPTKEDLARLDRLAEFGGRLQLVWTPSPELGVPQEPYTVWWRVTKPQLHRISPIAVPVGGGLMLVWGGEEATALTVRVRVEDPSRPAGLYLLREPGGDPLAAVGAAAGYAGAGQQVVLSAKASFARCALLVNATLVAAEIAWLRETILDDGTWEPLELVGHPADDGELGPYRPGKQGLVHDLRPGPEAAVARIERGGPPLGWWWQIETGRRAPEWERPDPDGLVREVRTALLPEIARVFDVPEPEQVQLIRGRNVAGPQQGGTAYTAEPTTADVPLLRTLLAAAGVDVFAALATGFATGYSAKDLPQHPFEIELLVTAPYSSTPDGGGGVEVACYVPPARPHTQVPPVVGLVARRAVLTVPEVRDLPFRESVELLWQPGPRTAALTGARACVLAGFAPADLEARDLLEARPNGGSAVRSVTVPEPDPDHPEIVVDPRPRIVDGGRPLLYEGSVTRGYSVAVANIFGVYSRWQDVAHVGAAPDLRGPRLVGVSLRSWWTGSSQCPAEASVEVAVPWNERTPTDVEILLVTYPMPTGATPPPAVDPDAPGAGARVAHLAFSGDEPVTPTPGVAVVGLDSGGTELSRTPVPDGVTPPPVDVPRPAGTATQGDDGRRYRLTIPVGPLDYTGVSRWGVRVFARLRALHHTQASAWSPRPEDPATAVAASPVPIELPPPPQPPHVPLASTPDHLGRNHVSVSWSGAGGADRVVVWETSETIARERLGLPAERPDLPGWRLAELRTAYDAATPQQRKNLFRRLQEVSLRGGDPGAVDVVLTRGSRDIHLFAVTTATTTGLESPWPGSTGTPHQYVRAALAPTVVRPAPPLVRPGIGPDGVARVTLEAASAIPVVSFEVFATRSPEAALDHRTMGPPRVTLPATPTDELDPVTRYPRYAAEWVAAPGGSPGGPVAGSPGELTGSWEPWLLRATAVPAPVLGPDAILGDASLASEVATLVVRPDAPDLDPLVASVSPDGGDVLISSATSIAPRATSSGSTRLIATVDGVAVASSGELESVPLETGPDAPAPVAAPTLLRRPREGGLTPLRLRLTRTDPSAPVAVVLRLTDPIGRSVERALEIPGWLPPTPAVTVAIDDVFTITGRGTVLTLHTNLPPTSSGTLRIVATRPRTLTPIPIPTPIPVPKPIPTPIPIPRPIPLPVIEPLRPILEPVRPGRLDGIDNLRLTQSEEYTIVIADIPAGRGGTGARIAKQERRDGGTDISVLLAAKPTAIRVEVTAGTGAGTGSAVATWQA